MSGWAATSDELWTCPFSVAAPIQDLSGNRYAGNPDGHRKLVEVCLPISLRHEQDTLPPVHIPIRKRLNANGRKPEGQGTQCAHAGTCSVTRQNTFSFSLFSYRYRKALDANDDPDEAISFKVAYPFSYPFCPTQHKTNQQYQLFSKEKKIPKKILIFLDFFGFFAPKGLHTLHPLSLCPALEIYAGTIPPPEWLPLSRSPPNCPRFFRDWFAP